MREGVRVDMPGRHLLHSIITDRSCSPQCGIHIAGLKKIALLRRVAPHASKAIRLQLQLHR